MSTASAKGYAAEHAIEQMWNYHGYDVHRPRAGAAADMGDIVGMPLVQSVKNHRAMALADWINGMETQVANAGLGLGVVWHKRRGRANPAGWYMSTSGAMGVVLVESYVAQVIAGAQP